MTPFPGRKSLIAALAALPFLCLSAVAEKPSTSTATTAIIEPLPPLNQKTPKAKIPTPEFKAPETSFSIMGGIEGFLTTAPDFKGKGEFIRKSKTIREKYSEIPEPEREAFIDKNLDGYNKAAREVDWDTLPETVRKKFANGLARFNNFKSNWTEGEEFSNKVLDHDPEDRDALINRSTARYGLKRFGRSFADADKAARLAPDSSAALTARALASYGLKNYTQALEDANLSLALDPNDKTAFMVMKLAQGRVKRPIKLPKVQAQQAAAVEREYQGTVHQLSQVAIRRKAVPAPATVPASTIRLTRSAARKIALKDYWGAIADSSKAIKRSPEYGEAYYYRAAARNLAGEYEGAVKDASQALIINPSDVQSRDARTWAFYQLGSYKRAMRDADRSIELDKKNPYAYANRAFIHEKLGAFEAMVADLGTASRLNPRFETVYRDAVARNSLSENPAMKTVRRMPGRPLSAQGTSRKTSFATILVSSLIGGFLIAAGLLHIMSEKWKKTISTEIRKATTGSTGATAPRRHSALDVAYDVGEEIGRGGMGVVYKAVDKALKRPVAIKMLRPEFKTDDRERERFLQEARTVAALHHPSIVDIHTILEDTESLYLVFEYIDGRSVDDLLAKKKRLTLTETKAIFKYVCQAVEYAHKHNVVHRDLKPSNIMISSAGTVKVMDFGIARRAKDLLNKYSQTNTVVGTPYYMAPEQEQGQVRAESDIFSMGACLYEMLTGERPYPSPASTPMKMSQSYAQPSRLAALPKEVDALVDDALNPDPDKRIKTPREFWARLEAIKEV